ncbi:pyridoxamine 5'-phosphate oxidase family protein [Consotaella salsifontis]|uniref:Pyridoxamine 5'-phosphate oxidase n=1 Tax=Consotaella salsifontis TaxID=1365950 RepID=A0A1T4SJU0_9HYPH|nr:pyridoxamine 5'-phosphate oxidase family protein [Consotaella salsifontis]SKA28564.1 Pyridoxamine 5'-phosphate oxidase [Consotaella salsifontis]
MAKRFETIDESRREFIRRQRMFFAASAAEGSRINISPRSTEHFHVLSDRSVAYLDLTGSGSETSAHLKADGRLTIMFCAFEGAPLILRLYGRGRSAFHGSEAFEAFLAEHYDGKAPVGARQIVLLDVELVLTSCGFGVPLFDYVGERPTLTRWAEKKGEEGLVEYRREKNSVSLDGLPTGMPEAADLFT